MHGQTLAKKPWQQSAWRPQGTDAAAHVRQRAGLARARAPQPQARRHQHAAPPLRQRWQAWRAAAVQRYRSAPRGFTGLRAGATSWPAQAWASLGLGPFQPETVVYVVMGANFAVFGLWQVACMQGTMHTHFTTSMSHLRMGLLHTLLTHSVSHATFPHLFTNMFTLYFFGTSLVHFLGPTRVRPRLRMHCA